MAADNRLQRAERQLHRLAQAADANDGVTVTRMQFGSLLRTVIEFYFIARALLVVGQDPDPVLVERITMALGGHDTPEDDTSTRARDAQFELAAAAVFRLAGIAGVRWAEPDLKILAGDQEVGVAIKRVSSPRKLERRMRDAARQIARHASDGVVVLGLDAWANVADGTPDTIERSVAAAADKARDIAAALPNVAGVFAIFGLAMFGVWDGLPTDVITGLRVSAHLRLIVTPSAVDIQATHRKMAMLGMNIGQALTRELSLVRL